MITTIAKRDGRVVPFEQEKIEQAIEKAFMASGSRKSAGNIRAAAAHNFNRTVGH